MECGKQNRDVLYGGVFDGVKDFYAAVRNLEYPIHFPETYQSGLLLHPSPSGYEATAEAIGIPDLRIASTLCWSLRDSIPIEVIRSRYRFWIKNAEDGCADRLGSEIDVNTSVAKYSVIESGRTAGTERES